MFHADVISIIAGGRSVRGIDLRRIPGTRIGVNDSFVHAECDIAVSMDRLWAENRWAALSHEGKPTYLRDAAARNLGEPPPWLTIFSCDISRMDLSEDWKALNGNNSGFCALNIAYLARPRKIFLFGFDMCGGYWYPGYSWNPTGTKGGRLRKWSKEFAVAAKQLTKAGIEVVNVGTSAVTAFRRASSIEAAA